MMDAEPLQASIPSVPFWALDLIKEVAAIKTLVGAIPKIEKEVDELRKESVPMREHESLMKRVNLLWDGYQKLKGAAWLFGVGNALLLAYVGLHAAGKVR